MTPTPGASLLVIRSPVSQPQPPSGLTRRRLLPLAAGAVLSLLPALRPPAAGALRQWCRTDPVVRIGGHTAHVYVDAYLKNIRQARALATGPTRIVITVPTGVPAQHIASDNGFGHGYDIVFAETDLLDFPPNPIPVRIEVRVPMSNGAVRVRSRFVPTRPGRLVRGGAEGTANVVFAFVAR